MSSYIHGLEGGSIRLVHRGHNEGLAIEGDPILNKERAIELCNLLMGFYGITTTTKTETVLA